MGLINWILKTWKNLVYSFAALMAGPPAPPVKLDPDNCQCTHPRCTHTKGIGKCHGKFKEGTQVFNCACQVFIGDGGRGFLDLPDPMPDIPSVEELEKWYRG